VSAPHARITKKEISMTPTETDTALPLAPGTWKLDPNHSSIHFAVRHLGISNVRGRFGTFDATLEIGETLETVAITATIDLSSVDTNNADRDAHIQGTDFFNVETHPHLTFTSTAVSQAGENYTLTGDLTIAGTTHPVVLDVEFNGTETFPVDQSTHAGFTATGEIRRSDFGIDFGIVPGAQKLLLSDKVKIELDIQFVAP
jgi:polyisoprenoid-binding protein YceI